MSQRCGFEDHQASSDNTRYCRDAIFATGDRFNQPGWKIFRTVQELLLKAASADPYEEELRFIISFYGSDFDTLLLPTQLEIFSQNFKADGKVTVSEIVTYFQNCSDGQ